MEQVKIGEKQVSVITLICHTIGDLLCLKLSVIRYYQYTRLGFDFFAVHIYSHMF